ncbi:MAG: cellulase family glycosylhydrolase [Deltaproteobacteria bacterium]|jgi:hypothetical protein|nr:cellulase family glycosylhydrolase [Deltaproteobacteria bacterium]MBW2534680.1 cellulase family glycosylhydrolase [Deltaproteobacteria bacterium]
MRHVPFRSAALCLTILLAGTPACSEDDTTPAGGAGGTALTGGSGGAAGTGGGTGGLGGAGGAGGTPATGLTREGRWLQYDGQYPFFVGYDYQSLAVRTDLDYTDALDHFESYRINKVRLWIYPWFMGEDALSPWAYAAGLHDLDEWNPAYWQRMHEFLDAAASRDIIVELSLFAPNWANRQDRFENTTWRVAYNATFNENGAFSPNAQGHFVPDFFDLDLAETSDSGQTLEDYQQALVDKAVSELASHRNVYFEICNEFPIVFNESQDAIHTLYPWQVQWSDRIHGATPRLVTAHSHQGSGAHTKGIEHFWDEPSVDVLNFHFYSGDPAEIAGLLHDAQAKSKVLQQNESFNHRTDLDSTTRETWAMFTAGGYGFFYGGDSDIPVIGDAEWQRGAERLRALRDIAESVPFWTMSPVDGQGDEYDGLVTQGPAGANWQVLADPGSAYVVYLWGSKTTTPLHIDLPAGSYSFEWLDPRNGDSLGTGTVSGADAAEIAAPPTADWDADVGLVLVVRS